MQIFCIRHVARKLQVHIRCCRSCSRSRCRSRRRSRRRCCRLLCGIAQLRVLGVWKVNTSTSAVCVAERPKTLCVCVGLCVCARVARHMHNGKRGIQTGTGKVSHLPRVPPAAHSQTRPLARC